MNIKRRNYIAIVIATAIAFGLYFFNKKSSDTYTRITSVIWTTEYHITYKGRADMTDSVNKVLNGIDNTLSMFNPNSTISRINANDTMAKPHPYVALLLNISKRINKESFGYYDPTVAPLVNLWGFGTKSSKTVPTDAHISEALQYVGIHDVAIGKDGSIRKKHPQTIIDFSSIAKGFACDELGRMLERNGIHDYIVEIGGEIRMNGQNPQAENWHVSIDQPIESDSDVIHQSAVILALTGKGIATSGNYRNYRKVNGKNITHIINPCTGYPEQSNLLSATIIANTAADADAYATACMAMGKERSIQMIQSNHNIDAILIYADSDGNLKTWNSKGIATMIQK